MYERNCIQKHIAEHSTSPSTNAKMGSQLINGRQILNMLRAFADAKLFDERLGEWDRNVAHANRRESLPTGEIVCFVKGEHVSSECCHAFLISRRADWVVIYIQCKA